MERIKAVKVGILSLSLSICFRAAGAHDIATLIPAALIVLSVFLL
jgi:hypothetical protein